MSKDFYKNYTSTSVLTGVDFEKFTSWSQSYFRAFILPHLPDDRNSQILEIGCGYGRYTHYLTNVLGYKGTTGVDISDEQIEFAKSKFKLTNVSKADALEYLESNPGPYEAVILMDVLEHLDLSYALNLLDKIKASLKPGGNLIIQVPNGLSPLTPVFHGDVTHVRAFSVRSMSQVLRMAGFTEFHHFSLPPLIHNAASLIRWVLWKFLVRPAIYLVLVLSHGNAEGGIYSSNLLTVARA